MSTRCIYTAGHGGWSVGELVKALYEAGVGCVVDVRSAPYSKRQPEFRKKPLEQRLAEAGLDYVYLGCELGGRPQDPDCYAAGTIDYATVRHKPFFRLGMARLLELFQRGVTPCLLCSEGKPWCCHRALLVGEILRDEGIAVQHILPDGSRLGQEAVMRHMDRGQGLLFDEPF